MRGDERIDIGQAIDARRVFEVGTVRVLVAVAKAHEGFMGPGVVVQHRNLDDPRVQRAFGNRLGLCTAHRCKQHVGCDAVGVEADLERGVGQADVQHALQRQALHRPGDGHAFEEGLERHAVADLGKQVLVGTKAVADRGTGKRLGHVCSFFGIFIVRQAKTMQCSGTGVWAPGALDLNGACAP
ncbi:hypothetical protein D3C73_1055950 [compost metagenome]